MRACAVTLVFLFSLSGITPAQIGAKIQENPTLIGNWENNQFGYQMMLILQSDGNGEFGGENLKFTYTEKTLTISQDESVTTYSYALEPSTLQLSGGDLPAPISFSRLSTSTPPVLTNGNINNAPTSSGTSQAGVPTSNEIIGSWSGSGELIEFKSNGQCAYLGQTFPYSVSDGSVTLSAADGNHIFIYRITGDELTLSSGQHAVKYTRSSNAGSTANGSTSVGNAIIDQQLVGKWCYVDVNSYNSGASSSSTCVTLNGDGTYTYYGESSRSTSTQDYSGGTSSQQSDEGTWNVEGDKINFYSRTLGQKTYHLERRNHPKNVNDPMIVLDGMTLVSYYNKPPWR